MTDKIEPSLAEGTTWKVVLMIVTNNLFVVSSLQPSAVRNQSSLDLCIYLAFKLDFHCSHLLLEISLHERDSLLEISRNSRGLPLETGIHCSHR
ncbi:hypothetical protein Pst134EA_009686 [Puccinia striiformis f. sp. tritici]|uniref:hypothetical protein n=1 Tax=Puccinia striiformis f. sp. tritici TaxID=168172 RepID=UPI002008E15C|nr:hypothetical protein Pst134EA_009686 [Puccinia striiformis f. sp. tritici]KAH9469157.1 hypothetical protein Pst134EA_009686 [Puccinia striiformis f. sp. tritici]